MNQSDSSRGRDAIPDVRHRARVQHGGSRRRGVPSLRGTPSLTYTIPMMPPPRPSASGLQERCTTGTRDKSGDSVGDRDDFPSPAVESSRGRLFHGNGDRGTDGRGRLVSPTSRQTAGRWRSQPITGGEMVGGSRVEEGNVKGRRSASQRQISESSSCVVLIMLLLLEAVERRRHFRCHDSCNEPP